MDPFAWTRLHDKEVEALQAKVDGKGHTGKHGEVSEIRIFGFFGEIHFFGPGVQYFGVKTYLKRFPNTVRSFLA